MDVNVFLGFFANNLKSIVWLQHPIQKSTAVTASCRGEVFLRDSGQS